MYIQIKIIAKMAYKVKPACLYCIYFIASLLLFHTATAQTKFSSLDKWPGDHERNCRCRGNFAINLKTG